MHEAGERSLEKLEAQMIQTGAELLVRTPGAKKSATEANNEAEANKSDLQRIVEGFEDGLDQALQITAEWVGIEDGGHASLFKDFGAGSLSDASAQLVLAMEAAGLITKHTAIIEQQRRGELSPDIDPEEELEAVAEQGPALGVVLDPITGLPKPFDPLVDPEPEEELDSEGKPIPGRKLVRGLPGPSGGPTSTPGVPQPTAIVPDAGLEAVRQMIEAMNAKLDKAPAPAPIAPAPVQPPFDLTPLVAAIQAMPAPQVTMPEFTMPDFGPALAGLTSAIDVLRAMPAPQVNVEAPVVNVPAPVVNVAAAEIPTPPKPEPRPKKRTVKFTKDGSGAITGAVLEDQ